MPGETDYCCGIFGTFVGCFGLAWVLVTYTPIPDDWIGPIVLIVLILAIGGHALNYWDRLQQR